MREIKFRIWHKNEKRWLDPWAEEDPMLSLKDCGKGCEVFLYERDSGDWSNQHCLMKDVVIQQYTGLKDKDGVEIYEGDVLEYADGITPEQKFEVKFCDERGSFIFHELYIPTFEGSDLPGWDDVILGKNAWDGWEIADEAIVLGNIFEGVDK